VAGEVLAIRRDLWQAPPPEVINDDFYLAATLLKRGYRVVYVPDAVSMERSTASETDERIRRTRIIAGRYQALAMARDVLPLGRPLLAWQMLSHKFTRPLVPFAMIGMALGSVAAAVAAADGTPRSRLGLGRAGARVALALQAVFYVFATVGRIRLLPGRAGRAAYVAAFLVDSNLAALAGFVRYRRGGQSAAWQRVRRDG
jgi:cellulose synthase/poly-beta-1,6-N-acetylglucosamine synthase-like glycosyltransferase